MDANKQNRKANVARSDRNRGVARRPISKSAAATRRLARWLELRSFNLTPEYFNVGEGLRAALAVAVPLAVIVTTKRFDFGWSVFAAFWTCLCDGTDPHWRRRRILLAFALFGALTAFLGSWVASLAPRSGMIAGPVLVFLAIFLPYRVPFSAQLATLLAVVAVVAIGFPHPLEGALVLAGAYLAGSLWAWILINVLWRLDPWRPLERASHTVLARLTDMAEALVATGTGRHSDVEWHSAHGEHRRAVRTAIERLRGLLGRFRDEPEERLAPKRGLLDAAETAFSALIALDHIFIVEAATPPERIATADMALRTLRVWLGIVADGRPHDAILHGDIAKLRKARAKLSDMALRGVLIGLEKALAATMAAEQTALTGRVERVQTPVPDWRIAARHALRQSAGVVVVYYIADLFGLGYPYWATMAVVVVMQGAVRVTWTRSIERIFGSLLGGIGALALLQVVPLPLALPLIAVPLAGITIALRTVNYTVFVVFLTMLFILTTELLQPGAGVASARILDNTLGSLAAILAMFALWPSFGPPLKVLLQRGLEANRSYIDAVAMRQDAARLAAARRAAGLASIEAEVALHDLGGFQRYRQGLTKEDAAALKELRRLAGEAAEEWHRHLAVGDQDA